MRTRLLAVPITVLAAVGTTLLAPAAASAFPVLTSNVHAAADHTLQVDYQVQETGYWCGPAATRIALSARGVYRSQSQLAAELGTTTGGTDWIGQVTGVLGG